MKEHKTDQLFRQKLQEHRVEPSAAAWEQLSAGLNGRRRKKGGYYAAAAVLALLLAASWFWLQYEQPQQGLQLDLAHNDQPAVVSPAQDSPAGNGIQSDYANEPSESSSAATPSDQKNSASVAASSASNPSRRNNVANASQANPATAAPVQDNTQDATQQILVEKPSEMIAGAAPARPESLTPTVEHIQPQLPDLSQIEMVTAQAEAVVIRYATSSANQPAEAEEAHENAPEKVLAVLQKVRQGEIGLARIRNAKDNLLSGKFNKP